MLNAPTPKAWVFAATLFNVPWLANVPPPPSGLALLLLRAKLAPTALVKVLPLAIVSTLVPCKLTTLLLVQFKPKTPPAALILVMVPPSVMSKPEPLMAPPDQLNVGEAVTKPVVRLMPSRNCVSPLKVTVPPLTFRLDKPAKRVVPLSVNAPPVTLRLSKTRSRSAL